MYEVNPVIYGTINMVSKFAINSQAKYLTPGVPIYINKRLDCVLKAHRYVNGTASVEQHTKFICVSPKHKGKGCTVESGTFMVTHDDLVYTKKPKFGNMLVRLHKGRCHACGKSTALCWSTLDSHLICTECISLSVVPPYSYGKAKGVCCYSSYGYSKSQCGRGLLLFSKSNSEVYQDALKLMSNRG